MRRWAIVALVVFAACHGPRATQQEPDAGYDPAFIDEQAKLAAWPAGADEGPEANAFYRTVLAWARSGKGRVTVQTSVRHLRHPVTGRTIVLVSAHHISSPAYFRGLERELADAEVVLNEGRNDDGFALAEAAPDVRWVSRYQIAAARCGRLVLQHLWEARIADRRWRSADLSLREISAVAVKEDVFGITENFKAQVRSMEEWTRDQSPAARAQARAWVVRDLVNQPLPDNGGTELDTRREAVVFDELRRLVRGGEHRAIALIYGAWHTRRLEPRIVTELGYRVYATTWHDALSYVYTPKEEATPAK